MNRYMICLGGWSALVYANDEDQIVQALAPVCARPHKVLDAPVWQEQWLGLSRHYLNNPSGLMRFQRNAVVAERYELADLLRAGRGAAQGLALALQIVREVAKTQAGYSDEREAIFEALSEAYVESQAPEQMLITGRRPGLTTLRAAQPSYEELRQRLLDLAEGARSKANLLASGSPSSIYIGAVPVLRALADEAEQGLIKQPNAQLTHAQALDQIQKLLSGKEWDSVTTVDISGVMGAAGYVIKDVDESGEG